ncbi:hypothetical protein V9T40_014827 [Parthenolecanium corni]|uniref:Uncharacterized protein n=1 Tax=Parthenolecanium corni TaxID=536013 RepID=A0AAN9T3C4_9HEMI
MNCGSARSKTDNLVGFRETGYLPSRNLNSLFYPLAASAEVLGLDLEFSSLDTLDSGTRKELVSSSTTPS